MFVRLGTQTDAKSVTGNSSVYAISRGWFTEIGWDAHVLWVKRRAIIGPGQSFTANNRRKGMGSFNGKIAGRTRTYFKIRKEVFRDVREASAGRGFRRADVLPPLRKWLVHVEA